MLLRAPKLEKEETDGSTFDVGLLSKPIPLVKLSLSSFVILVLFQFHH
jgi:hypothetical protein